MDGLLDRRSVSLDVALALVAAVRDEASSRGLAMDSAALGAMPLAVGKAYTTVLWDTPTGAFTASTQPGGDDWGWNATDSRIVVYAGGVPLRADGALVGAVGASGATAAEDESCVLAAVEAAGFS